MSVQHITRRTFVQNTGLACTAAVLGMASGTAFAAEASPADSAASDPTTDAASTSELGIIAPLAERATLHGLEGSEYDPNQPVSEQDVQAILTAGFSAPTAVGQQCLEFVVVTDREAMLPIIEHNENANELTSCPLLICLIEHDSDTSRSRFYQYDSGIAAMAMVAQATALGLSTCIMSMKTEDNETGETLYYESIGLGEGTEEYHPQLMISFGYPAPDAVSSASVDNYDEARVHEQAIEA